MPLRSGGGYLFAKKWGSRNLQVYTYEKFKVLQDCVQRDGTGQRWSHLEVGRSLLNDRQNLKTSRKISTITVFFEKKFRIKINPNRETVPLTTSWAWPASKQMNIHKCIRKR